MMISAGVFGAWDQLKHATPQLLILPILYNLVLGFNDALAPAAYSQGLAGFIPSYGAAKAFVFDKANIPEEVGKAIWEDMNFGMGKWVTLQTWVNALRENIEDGVFVYPSNVQGSLYPLVMNFGLSEAQITAIFSGYFKTAYDTILLIFLNNYGCEGNVECDPTYIGALQWSQSLVTNEPPAGLPSAGPSIVLSNNSVTGFPEINYFLIGTDIGKKYPDVQFTVEDYYSLFYYDRITGFPKWSNYTLLDVGHINHIYELGLTGNFNQMQKDFGLSSVNKARVLWDYLNALIAYAGLQGNIDPSVYDQDNRGIASEAGAASLGTQAMYGVWMGLAEIVPISISSTYFYLRLEYELTMSCEMILSQVLPGEDAICSIPELQWGNNTATISMWILPYWNGINSDDGVRFQNISGLSDEDMEALFDIDSPLVDYFSMFDNELKLHYGCTNTGPRCFSWDLAAKQWGRGFVTENLPSIFSIFGIENTTSIYNIYQEVRDTLTAPPEYWAYLERFKRPMIGLTDAQIYNALTFDRLLGITPLQRFFIYDFEGNYTQMKLEYLMNNPLDLLNYVRWAVDKFVFKGLFKAKTVEEILWTDEDAFLTQLKYTNPLLGGNPSLNPSLTQLGQNQTREMYEYIPLGYRHALNTGATDLDEVRWYRLYNGQPYINMMMEWYYGESPWGSIIDWEIINPWTEYVSIAGSDTWSNQPDLDKDSTITFYLLQASLIIETEYVTETTHRGFRCLKFNVSPNQLKNATQVPSQAVFYQFAPLGLINQTSILQAPLFGSKPYFLDGDPVLMSLVNYSRPELNVPEEYESFLNIEPITGTNFYVLLQLQYNAELKPDALYPNLGRKNLEKTGYRTYLPVIFLVKTEEFSQKIVDEKFGNIKTAFMLIEIIQIVGYGGGAILLVSFGMYLLKLRINKKRQEYIQDRKSVV